MFKPGDEVIVESSIYYEVPDTNNILYVKRAGDDWVMLTNVRSLQIEDHATHSDGTFCLFYFLDENIIKLADKSSGFVGFLRKHSA